MRLQESNVIHSIALSLWNIIKSITVPDHQKINLILQIVIQLQETERVQ